MFLLCALCDHALITLRKYSDDLDAGVGFLVKRLYLPGYKYPNLLCQISAVALDGVAVTGDVARLFFSPQRQV